MTGQTDRGRLETPQEAPSGASCLIDRIIRAIDLLGCIVCAATLCVLFLAILSNVFLRYAMNSGIVWAYEIHALLLPWLVAGGVVIAATRGRHIAVTLLPAMVTGWPRFVIYVCVNLAVIAIAVEVVWSSQPILRAAQFQTLGSLGIKQIWGYASIPAAFGAMAVVSGLELLRLATGGLAATPDPSPDSLS